MENEGGEGGKGVRQGRERVMRGMIGDRRGMEARKGGRGGRVEAWRGGSHIP